MKPEPTVQLQHILPALCDLVDNMDAGRLDAPTPCDAFAVRDVLDHIIVLGGSFAYVFRGEEPPPAQPPARTDQVPKDTFRAAMDDLLAAVCEPASMTRELTTPLGVMDGSTFARVVAFDGLVHGWDLAVATGERFDVDHAVIAAADEFARVALTPELRAGGLFAAATTPPDDASTIERLAAWSGRNVDRWRSAKPQHVDKHALPAKIDVPGAKARQVVGFGDATGYGTIAGEYFSLGAGTDIAPLLAGLEHDTCHAPHWGYMIAGAVVVSFVDGTEVTCTGGELFYWPPGHSVRVTEDAEVVLFSPQREHVDVMDHMLATMGA